MQISQKDWNKYRNKLASLSDKAADAMDKYLTSRGGYENIDRDELIAYAYGLATKYGEGTAALSAEMYDEVAAVSGVYVPAADVAETASYSEVAKTVNGVIKNTGSSKVLSDSVGRLVKRAGADTTLKNSQRDGAQFAWIPGGDGCAFCLTLASRGWQNISANSWKNGHAEHIHPNCTCTYAIRFDGKSNVKGYDPDKYLEMYESAEGDTSREKINSIRKIQYQENKDRLNEQRRSNYAEKRKNILNQHKKGDKVYITDQAIDKVKAIGPSNSSLEEKSLMQEMNKKILAISKELNDSNEVAMALFNNLISKEVLGDYNHVKVLSDPDMYHIIKGQDIPLRSVVLSHNHPGLSYFSADDVKIFVDNPTIKTLEVVTNTGKTWYISKKENYDDAKVFDMFYETVRDDSDDPDKVVDVFLRKAHNVIEKN